MGCMCSSAAEDSHSKTKVAAPLAIAATVTAVENGPRKAESPVPPAPVEAEDLSPWKHRHSFDNIKELDSTTTPATPQLGAFPTPANSPELSLWWVDPTPTFSSGESATDLKAESEKKVEILLLKEEGISPAVSASDSVAATAANVSASSSNEVVADAEKVALDTKEVDAGIDNTDVAVASPHVASNASVASSPAPMLQRQSSSMRASVGFGSVMNIFGYSSPDDSSSTPATTSGKRSVLSPSSRVLSASSVASPVTPSSVASPVTSASATSAASPATPGPVMGSATGGGGVNAEKAVVSTVESFAAVTVPAATATAGETQQAVSIATATK